MRRAGLEAVGPSLITIVSCGVWEGEGEWMDGQRGMLFIEV